MNGARLHRSVAHRLESARRSLRLRDLLTFVAREECLFRALAPKFDSVAQRVNSLLVATYERAPEIDPL